MERFPVFAAAPRDGEHHHVTEDESWFLFTYPPRRMWTLTRDGVAATPKHDIHTKKFMFREMWNSLGFHVVEQLPIGAKMNSDYFTTKRLAPLEQQMFPARRRPHPKRLTFHLDHCAMQMRGP
jgi:hypothetical protein